MKKRILSVILCIVMLLSVIPMGLASALIAGDIDGDDGVSAADARLVLRASVGLETLSAEQIAAADADRDGTISAADARLVLRASVGLETLHSHEYTGAVTTAATCINEGVMTYTCSCGDAYTEAIAKTGHTAVKDNAIAPTCTEKGKTEGSHCSVCNAVITPQQDVAAKGHSYTAVVTAPTCTEKGYTTYTCSCGDTYKANETAAKKHTYTSKVTKAATCTKAGTRTYTCSCGDTYTEAIAKKGHSYTSAITTPASCTEKGVRTYTCKNDASHTYTEEIKATGHSMKTESVDPDCISEGYTVEKCKSCDYVDQSSYKATGAAKGHTFGTPETVAPTCEEQGYTYKTCSVCTATEKYDYTDALGHDDKRVSQKNPTCKATGEQKVKCSRCKREDVIVLPLAACKADEDNPVFVAGNGTTPCKELYKCKTCGKTLYEIETHRLEKDEESEFNVAVSCTTNATVEMDCIHCNYSIIEITEPAHGHKAPINMEESHYATCEEDGKMVYTDSCTVCGESLDGKVITIPATGHVSDGSVRTCTNSVTCITCGDILEQAFGHDTEIKSTWAKNTDAHAFYCYRCGESVNTTNAAKLEAFNLVTSTFKRYNGLNIARYFTKSYTDSTYKTFDFGLYTSMIEDMYKEEMGKSEDDYSPVRTVQVKRVPVSEAAFSLLTLADLDTKNAITVERLTGLSGASLLKDFNPTYAESSTGYEHFNRYKALNIKENVIKVTLNVKNENLYTIVNNNVEMTALQKIYDFDIRAQVNGYTLKNGKYFMTESQKEDGYEMTMNMTVESIDTDAVVTFYFLESTYEPIMAIYDIYDTIDSSVSMSFKIGLTIKGNMRPVIKTHNTSVFVFEKTIENF